MIQKSRLTKPVTYSSSEGVASPEDGETLEVAEDALRILKSKRGLTKSQARAEEGAGVKVRREEAVSSRHKVGKLFHLTDAFAAEVTVTDTETAGATPVSGKKLVQFVVNVTRVSLSFMTQPYAYMLLEHKLDQMRVTHKGILGIRHQIGAARLHP